MRYVKSILAASIVAASAVAQQPNTFAATMTVEGVDGPTYPMSGVAVRTNTVADSALKKARYCGLFKTPTLRNVERTAPYFHNGAVRRLEDAVRFHFERDVQPESWFRKADGTVDVPYNDLPAAYRRRFLRG